jgi:hypothetical protein
LSDPKAARTVPLAIPHPLPWWKTGLSLPGKNDKAEIGAGLEERYITSPEQVKFFGKQIASFGDVNAQGFILTNEGDLYFWGTGFFGDNRKIRRRSVPTFFRDWKWELPKCYLLRKWKSLYIWLFLGKLDSDSPISQLHVEIIFNFVQVEK